VYTVNVGYRDMQTGQPYTSETIVRLASMTKPVTAAAVMILVQQGKLGLDEPLAKYDARFR
jgi:CubicO group peptidase (beta-lactamase class C family)